MNPEYQKRVQEEAEDLERALGIKHIESDDPDVECGCLECMLEKALADFDGITFRIGRDGEYKSVRLLTAYGGPNIFIDTEDNQVHFYWPNEYVYPIPEEVVKKIDEWAETIYKEFRHGWKD